MELVNSLPPHMRPKSIFTPEQASQRANKVRHELFKSWYRLKAIILAHEDTIQKRWKKRTAVKRKKLLQEINSKLPMEHAPEIAALGAPEKSEDDRDVFVLPYLNLEDLSVNNGTQFLGLLHARAHHFPSEFVWFDDDTIHFGIVAGGIHRYHAVDCAMIAFGDEATYGKVLPYPDPLDDSDDDSPDGFQMEHMLRESISFGNGLLVLETQSKLMNFLLGVVSKILDDLDLSTLMPSAPLPTPVIPILNTEFQWKSSARANAQRPYGPPPVFSIDDIAVLLDSQYELSVQHLADLRTDPMYLAETIQSYYDHRPEKILGQASPALIQNRAVSLMLTDAYSFLAHYHVAKSIIDDFRVVQAKFPNGVARARDLPPEYEEVLKKLYPLLALLQGLLTKVHCNTIHLRRYDLMAFSRRSGDQLYTYMTILLQEDQTHLRQVSRIFDQIDRITQDPVEHKRISPLIAGLLSQWGTINDRRTILQWHRSAVEETENPQEGAQQRLQKWIPLFASIISNAGPEAQLADKAFPVSRFMYPKGPRSDEWAAKCQRVDDAFSAFWTAADRLMVKRCGKELFALGTSVVAPFAVARTNWAELAKPKVPQRRDIQPAVVLPFGGASQNTAADTEEVRVAKTKPKTRGVATAVHEDADRNQEVAEKIDTEPPRAVSAKVYKRRSEEIQLQQGSVTWKDTQTAFAQLDFTLHKTRGSAWIFRHPDGRRSVTGEYGLLANRTSVPVSNTGGISSSRATPGADDEVLGSAPVWSAPDAKVRLDIGVFRLGCDGGLMASLEDEKKRSTEMSSALVSLVRP
ncbi:hypothetical protein DFH07DRAFT_768409 [Mycena maculata]|uniref:Uncharacterized protein n=1 Tax=Mycena maculata TaxID=230809 RepID=A0AAD7JSY7_9AGAR|nr:hypothetical protein DFH07DRAFT_768409 [Mycena maculata]